MKNVLIGALFAVLVAACSSTPTKDGGAPVDDKSTTAGAGGAATSGTNAGGVAGNANAGDKGNPLKDPNNVLSKRIVLFEYDSYTVRDQDKPIIEAHARYLVTNRNGRLLIQGHTDERGSREYNIALGQKRADAVKRMMVLLGANEIQIETVSFGKEKPRNSGHDEGSWSDNRRDELVYQGE